jgi:hypothetical protein
MIRNTAGTILLAATVTAAALTQATHVRAAGKFDGNWSVAVYTRSGPCDAAYRFSGQIVNGVIVYNGGLGPIDFSGRVRPNGAAYLRVASGSAFAVGAPALGTGKRPADVAPATGLRSGAKLFSSRAVEMPRLLEQDSWNLRPRTGCKNRFEVSLFVGQIALFQ